jgi:hypothetical protein
MSLSGDDDLHRKCAIVENAAKPFDVSQKEIGPLIASEPPGETEGQDVRIENVVSRFDTVLIQAALGQLPLQPLADERYQLTAA